MPKNVHESRPTFSTDLKEKLLEVARERGRPETDASPLLEALAREWIEKGSYRRREEELELITCRLDAIEGRIRELAGLIAGAASRPTIDENQRAVPVTLDNLAARILEHLTSIADADGITPQVSADNIADGTKRPGDRATAKRIMSRIDKLLALRLISIEEDSGGGGGRRYRISGGK